MSTANTVEVRRPKVTVSDEATDSLVIVWSLPVINGAPAARYSAHKSGGEKVESPTAQDIIQKIAAAQEAMFLPPEKKTVTINDGKNGIIFDGYDTGPHHDIMFGGVNTGRNLVHRCARLFFLNTGIYGQVPAADNAAYGETVSYLAGATTPCDLIKKTLEQLIKNFERQIEGDSSDSAAIKKRIHRDNQKIINEEWFPILNASTESSIRNFARIVDSYKDTMYQAVSAVYLNGAADFSVVLTQFEAMFQMRFIPNPRGTTAGKFIPFSKLLNDPIEKEVNVVSLSMNPGPKKFLSVSGVAMKGTGAQQPATGETVPYAGTEFVVWPDPIPDNGQIAVVQQPNWLPSMVFANRVNTAGKNLDIDANAAAVENANKQIGDIYVLMEQVCQEICRQMYGEEALREATATIVSPLDVSWEIGNRYTVKQFGDKAGGGEVLFSGFLREVQHRVSSNPSRAEATTQLTFSHVEAKGFTLPNK